MISFVHLSDNFDVINTFHISLCLEVLILLSAALKTPLLAIMLFSMTYSCQKKASSEVVLKYPVPEPIAPLVLPDPTIKKEDPEKEEPPSAEISTVPVFLFTVDGDQLINEAELWKAYIAAAVSDGSPVQYFYQCSYACPNGISISDTGEIEWRPSYEQAGVYDIKFFASNLKGETAYTNYVRFTVLNVNRAPEIESITIVPNKTESPDSITCNVKKSDPDNDVMITKRSWFINGVENPLYLTQTLSTTNFSANDKIECRAEVQDSFGAKVVSLMSAPYTVPNKAPEILNVILVNQSRPGQGIKVGDTVTCQQQTFDADGHTVTKVRSQIMTLLSNVPVYSVTGSGVVNYKIVKSDSHKSLICKAVVTDGYVEVEKLSTAVLVNNSEPLISSLSLELIPPSTSLKTGDIVRCVVEFDDPDGDLIAVETKFLNSDIERSEGIIESVSSQKSSRHYRLRTRLDVSSPSLADIRGALMSCKVKASDNSGAFVEAYSNKILVEDKSPTLILNSPSAALSQTIFTSNKMEDVNLLAVDLDGDTIEFVKSSDSCLQNGINFSINNQGVVSSTAVPQASFPQKPRDCQVSYSAVANNLTSTPQFINLIIPNRAPSLTCNNSGSGLIGENPVIRYLKTAKENAQRQLIQPLGQSVGEDSNGNVTADSQIICKVTDPDGELPGALIPAGGEFGDSFQYYLSDSLDGKSCILGALDTGFYHESELRLSSFSSSAKKISGKMGLDECAKNLKISDGNVLSGGMYSNEVTLNLKPLIDLRFSDALTFDNACYLNAGGIPTFNNGFSYDDSLPAQISFAGDIVSADDLTVGKTGFEAKLSEFFLNANNYGNGVFATWTMNARQGQLLMTSRELSRKWNVSSSSNAEVFAYPWRPSRTIKKDVSDGRQVSSSSTCVKESACVGLRSSVAAGSDHTCVLNSGGFIQCWGANDRKQLGYSTDGITYATETTPKIVDGIDGATPANRALVLASGAQHSCALMEDGKIKCWGLNRYGQLGRQPLDSTGLGTAEYVTTVGDQILTGAISVAAGNSHSCALMSSGKVMCWGLNSASQMGVASAPWNFEYCIGAQPCYALAREVSGISNAVGIYAGGDVSCAVLKSGEGYCWGESTYGQLGHGSYSQNYAPVKVKSLERISSFSIGNNHNCAATMDGRSYCWGEGSYGELGDGLLGNTNEANISSPAYAGGVAQMSAGLNFTCAITTARKVECFGNNTISSGIFGQLGAGSNSASSSTKLKVLVNSGLELSEVVALTNGAKHSCAVTYDKKIYCWGANDKGQSGNASIQASSPKASQVVGGAFSAVQTCPLIYSLIKE